MPYLGQFWEEDGTNSVEYFDGEKAREHFLVGTVGPVLGSTVAGEQWKDHSLGEIKKQRVAVFNFIN